jgi:hypothetical protein
MIPMMDIGECITPPRIRLKYILLSVIPLEDLHQPSFMSTHTHYRNKILVYTPSLRSNMGIGNTPKK